MSGFGTPTPAPVHRTAPRWATAPVASHPPPQPPPSLQSHQSSRSQAHSPSTRGASALQIHDHERPRSLPHTTSSSSHASPSVANRSFQPVDGMATSHAQNSGSSSKSTSYIHSNTPGAPVAGPSSAKSSSPSAHSAPAHRPAAAAAAAPLSAPASTTSYITAPLSAALAARSPLWRATHPQVSEHAAGDTPAAVAASSSSTSTPGSKRPTTDPASSANKSSRPVLIAAALASTSTPRQQQQQQQHRPSADRVSPPSSSSVPPPPPPPPPPPAEMSPTVQVPSRRARVSTATATPPPPRSATPSSSRLRGSSELHQTDHLSDAGLSDAHGRRASSSFLGEGSAEPSSRKKKKAPRRGWKGWAIEVVDEYGNKSIRSPSPEPEPAPDAPKRRRGRPRKHPLPEEQGQPGQGEPSNAAEGAQQEREQEPEQADEDGPEQGRREEDDHDPVIAGDTDDIVGETATPDQNASRPRQEKPRAEAHAGASTASKGPRNIAAKNGNKSAHDAGRPSKRTREPSPERSSSSKRLRSRASTPPHGAEPVSAARSEPRAGPSQPQKRGPKPRRSEPARASANGNGNGHSHGRRASDRPAPDGQAARDSALHSDDHTEDIPSPPESAMRSTNPVERAPSKISSNGQRPSAVHSHADGETRKAGTARPPSSSGNDEKGKGRKRPDSARTVSSLPNVDDEARFIIQSATKEREQRQREERRAPKTAERRVYREDVDGVDALQRERFDESFRALEQEERRRRAEYASNQPQRSRRESHDKGLRGRELQDHEWSAILHDHGRGSVDGRDDMRSVHSARDVKDRSMLSPPSDRDPRDSRINGRHAHHMHTHPPPPPDPRFYGPSHYGYYPSYYPPYGGPPPLHPSHQYPVYPPHGADLPPRHLPHPQDDRSPRVADPRSPHMADSEWVHSSRRVTHDTRDRLPPRSVAPMPPHTMPPMPQPAAPAAPLSRRPDSSHSSAAPVPPPQTAQPAHSDRRRGGPTPSPGPPPPPPAHRRPPSGWTSNRAGYTDVVPMPYPAGQPYNAPEPRPPSQRSDYPSGGPAPRGSEYPRSLSRGDIALSKAHAEGFDGLDISLEENARGFVENVKNNLRTLVGTYFAEPSASRDAFLERIGRDLTSFGWELTDSSDGALYSRDARSGSLQRHRASPSDVAISPREPATARARSPRRTST